MRQFWQALQKRLIRGLLSLVGLNVNLFVEVHDAATGDLLHTHAVHNLVVDAGLNLLRDFLGGFSASALSYFAVGTGTTAVAASDTTLEGEVYRDTFTKADNSASKSLVLKYYLPSAKANGNTLAKVGLFNAASGGTLFAEALLATVIVKDSSIAVTFTWTINLGAS